MRALPINAGDDDCVTQQIITLVRTLRNDNMAKNKTKFSTNDTHGN